MQGSRKIDASEKRLIDVTTSWRSERKYTGQGYRGAGEIDKGDKGIYELKRRIIKIEMAQVEREHDWETMDKNTLYYCIPNLQNFVHQTPQCCRVLACFIILSLL